MTPPPSLLSPPFTRRLRQTYPACSKPFGYGLGVRSDCADRGRRYVIMSHSQGIGDRRHLALAQSIRDSDPDYNNFRTRQVAPGCVAGPENWVYYTDADWAIYFARYTRFKSKSLREQQRALARDLKLTKLVSRIDRQLTDKTIHFDHSCGALELDREYYAL